MRPCDRCGARVADTVGKRQTSLFDTVDVDSRATDEARAELRAGRVLCPACARTPELFPTVAPVRITAPRDPFPRAVVDAWTSQGRA